MMPVYLAEIEMLAENDPLLLERFKVVNKKEVVPFILCSWHRHSIGKCQQIVEGLVGITLNQSSRNKFFLMSPHMTR